MHITIETLKVEVLPKAVSLKTMSINSSAKFQIRVRNKNKNLPIYFNYQKSAFVDVQPSKGKLNSEEYVLLSVTFTPKCAIESYICLPIQFLSPDQNENESLLKNLRVVDVVKVRIFAKVKKTMVHYLNLKNIFFSRP